MLKRGSGDTPQQDWPVFSLASTINFYSFQSNAMLIRVSVVFRSKIDALLPKSATAIKSRWKQTTDVKRPR